MWKKTRHSNSSLTLLDGKVSDTLNDLKDSSATSSDEFKRAFDSALKEIPKSGAYPADHLYRAIVHDSQTVHIMKLNLKGDFKRKMWTMEYSTDLF